MKVQHVFSRAILPLLLLCVSVSAAAFDPPDNFRGIKWGSRVADSAARFKLIEDDGDKKSYIRSGDKLSIGDAKLDRIVYGFYKDRFYAVLISFADDANFKFLRETLSQTYGWSRQPNEFMEHYYWGLWDSPVTIGIEYSQVLHEGAIKYLYNPILDELENDTKRKARESGKDL